MKFLSTVVTEMKKVTWPNKQQLRKYTLTVINTSIIFTVLFFVMDTVIQTVFNWILK